MTIKLIYIGRGAAIPGVPARDLTDEDFKERAEQWAGLGIDEAALVNSGLYEKPKSAEQPKKSKKDSPAVFNDFVTGETK